MLLRYYLVVFIFFAFFSSIMLEMVGCDDARDFENGLKPPMKARCSILSEHGSLEGFPMLLNFFGSSLVGPVDVLHMDL